MKLGELSLMRPGCVVAAFHFTDVADDKPYLLAHVLIDDDDDDPESAWILLGVTEKVSEPVLKRGDAIIVTGEYEIAGFISSFEGRTSNGLFTSAYAAKYFKGK